MKILVIYFNYPKVFNGCPLRINCTASWIHPETHNQHILVGADEGIYTLNLNEIHENAMDLLYPRPTVWMFVIKDVLMTLSGNFATDHLVMLLYVFSNSHIYLQLVIKILALLGKTPSLFRHDLNGLHSKQSDRLTISMNAMHRYHPSLFQKSLPCHQKWPIQGEQVNVALEEIHTTATNISVVQPQTVFFLCSGTTRLTSLCF